MVEPSLAQEDASVDRVVVPISEPTVIVGFNDRAYVDWSAVIGGAVVALALWMLLTSFGASIGLFVTPPWSSLEDAATTLTIATAAWFAIVQIFSVATGAYFSGRLRQRVADGPAGEVMFRDGANGLLVWGLGLLIATWIAVLAAFAGVATGATDAERVTQPTQVAGVVDRMFRPDLTGSSAEADASAANGAAIAIVPRTRRDSLNREEVVRIIEQGEGESLAPADRNYLAALVAAHSNLGIDQAKSRVDETLRAWKAEQKEAAEETRKAAALIGLWTVVVLLLSALAAWWAGSLGGHHRDDLK